MTAGPGGGSGHSRHRHADMLIATRAARASLEPGDLQHGPCSAPQPGLIVLHCHTPAGEKDAETQSRKPGDIL